MFVFKVHGIIRRSSSFNTARIEHLYKDIINHKGGGRCPVLKFYYTLRKKITLSWTYETGKCRGGNNESKSRIFIINYIS